MAAPRWNPTAGNVADIWTCSITAYDAATTYALTVNNKSVSKIAAGSANATAAALVAAWNAASYGEMREATATNPGAPSANITLTMDTPGVPLIFTLTATGGTGTVSALTNTQVATGLNWWNNAANWTTGSIPTNGDTAWVDGTSSIPILYGLAQSGVTLAALNVAAAFTTTGGQSFGQIGLPDTNSNGTPYQEYRPLYLSIGATVQSIGYGPGQGSSLIRINNGSVQTALTIWNSQTQQTNNTNLEAVQWKGTHASNVVKIVKGSLGIAAYGGDLATILTLTVGYVTSPTSDSAVRGGAGLTLGTMNMSGGTVQLNAGLTTVAKDGGALTINSGSVTTWTDQDSGAAGTGSSTYNGAGTIGTLTLSGATTFSLAEDPNTVTISAMNMYAGSALADPNGVGVYSTGIALKQCRVGDVTIDVGPGRTLSVA